MSLVSDILTGVFLTAGVFFCVAGALGILRLPDFFSRTHAAGIIDTMGAPLIIIGLTFQSGLTLTTVKLLIILLFLVFASPLSGHALAKAALSQGFEPMVGSPKPRPQTEGENPSKA